MCGPCHSVVEPDKQGWYRRAKIKELGIDRFKALERLHNQDNTYSLLQLLKLRTDMIYRFKKLKKEYIPYI